VQAPDILNEASRGISNDEFAVNATERLSSSSFSPVRVGRVSREFCHLIHASRRASSPSISRFDAHGYRRVVDAALRENEENEWISGDGNKAAIIPSKIQSDSDPCVRGAARF